MPVTNNFGGALSDTEALAASVTCLMTSASSASTWSDFQVEWDPIITCLSADLLMSCGLRPELPWYVPDDDGTFNECKLTETFKWLNNAIRPDGSFGTDAWDALQMALLIERRKLHKYFGAYPTLRTHLIDAVRTDNLLTGDTHWAGPAFLALGALYTSFINEPSLSRALLADVLSRQDGTGCWQGIVDADNHPVISPVWHTAQCVVVLVQSDRVNYQSAIAAALSWLTRTQDAAGHWKSVQQYNIYFTSYAAIAFAEAGEASSEPARKAISYLKQRMNPEGRCSDLGGTLMCALALRAVVGDRLYADLRLADYLLSRQNVLRAKAAEASMRDAEARLQRAETELAALKAKYGDADIVLTKKQLFLITLVGLLVTVLGTVVGVYGLQLVVRPPAPQAAPASIANQSPRQPEITTSTATNVPAPTSTTSGTTTP